MTIISVGADHGGFELKEVIVQYLKDKGYEVLDRGTYSSDSVDYPHFTQKVARDVQKQTADFGILVCGTGIGVSIAANKYKGIRAALVGDVFSAQATRAHNDTNILCLGGRVTGDGLALLIVDTWLATEFEGGRHQNRIDLIDSLAEETE